jgi:hypothetical protein
VNAPDLASLFPMTYTLALDTDGNNIFNQQDLYSFGIDSSQPSIDLSGLAYGRYRITVGSSSGCNLKTFDFLIFNCYGIILPSRNLSLLYKGLRDGQRSFEASLNGIRYIKSVQLEGSVGDGFKEILTSATNLNLQNIIEMKISISDYVQFRLKVIDQNNVAHYSNIVKMPHEKVTDLRFWPNPVNQILFIRSGQGFSSTQKYTIVNAMGVTTGKGEISGSESFSSISVANLRPGIYQLVIMETNQRVSRIKFVKE